MKYIIFLFFMILSFSSQAKWGPDSTCSMRGTIVIYTNGVDTKEDDAFIAMRKIQELGLNSKIDSKKVTYRLGYNYNETVSKDILETIAQRLPKSYLNALKVSNAYAAFSQLLQGNLIQSIASSVLNSIVEKKIEILVDYSRNRLNLPLYNQTVGEIKAKYVDAFKRGERVFAISHSQGSLFMNDVYNLLPSDEVIRNLSDPDIDKYFAGFQVASVLPSEMNSNFGYATNSKDRVVNAVRLAIGALPANLNTPLVIDNDMVFDVNGTITAILGDIKGDAIEIIANHGMLTTYLYDSTLKPQVMSNLVATAELLESNCIYANIEYTKNNLEVLFDSGDPQDRNPEGLTYVWTFGDGQTATTNEELFPHTYLQPGTYPLSLTVKDQSGNEVSANSSIVVVSDIKAVINYTKNNLQVNFDSTDPQNPGANDLTYSWNFGDGQTGNTTSQTFSHNFSVAGTYNVSLTVTDAYGASDTAQASVVVQSSVSNLTICNGGKVPITMSFSSPEIPSFTLEHINHYGQDASGNMYYINSTCECKSVSIPQGKRVGIHVEGYGLPDWLSSVSGIIPYDGYIFAQSGIQYFTVTTSVQNNLLYYALFKGEAHGAECQEYTYK